MISDILYNKETSQKLVIKLAGTVCNIDCTYCFEKAKDLTFKNKMTVDVLAQKLQMIDKKTDILFHGGEPLLIGKKIFREMLENVRLYTDKIKNVAIQTNGTLLDKDWVKLLFEDFLDLDIQISISLDGSPEMNKLRIAYDGKPTYEKVIEAFDLLNSVNKKVGLLSVIGKHALNSQEEYIKTLSSIPNLLFVKINALYDTIPNRLLPNSITPSQFTDFLQGVTSEWINTKSYEKYPIEPLISYIQKLSGVGSKYCVFNSRKCLNFSTLYPDGSMGICDNFSKQEFPIKINNELGFSNTLENLSNSNYNTPFSKLYEKCKTCNIQPLCEGGCLSQRMLFKRNVPELYEDYCVHRKEMFNFMKDLLGKGM